MLRLRSCLLASVAALAACHDDLPGPPDATPASSLTAAVTDTNVTTEMLTDTTVALPAHARVVDVAFAAAGAEVLVLLDGPEPGLVRVDAGTLAPKGRLALSAPTALAVPAQRRTATSK